MIKYTVNNLIKLKDGKNMKHYFIVNPAAGKGKDPKALIEKIEGACREKLIDFEIYLTKAKGDATRFVKEKCEAAREKFRIFSCGGDGTNNEVISGAVGCDCAEVGFVPDGTGNDFIKCFKEPDNFTDIDAQLEGESESIDLISCNDKYIMNIMNMGFDCEVVRRTDKLKKLPLVSKSMAYILGVVVELIRKPGIKLKASIDGGEAEERSLLLSTFSNGRYYGGGFHASPKARLKDGLMDVCLVKNISRTKFISLVKYYRSGEYLDMEKFNKIVDFKKCREAFLEFETEQSFCIDGEIFEAKSLLLRLIPRALNIIIPKGSSFAEDELLAPESVPASV